MELEFSKANVPLEGGMSPGYLVDSYICKTLAFSTSQGKGTLTVQTSCEKNKLRGENSGINAREVKAGEGEPVSTFEKR